MMAQDYRRSLRRWGMTVAAVTVGVAAVVTVALALLVPEGHGGEGLALGGLLSLGVMVIGGVVFLVGHAFLAAHYRTLSAIEAWSASGTPARKP